MTETTQKPNGVARTRRSKATHARILAAAANIFYKEGIASVRMEEVADAAPVSKPTLYKHFRSKDELVAEALDSVDDLHFEWFVKQVDTLVATQGTPPAIAVFDVLTKWFNSASFRGCTFINSSVEVGTANPPAQQAVLRHKSRTRAWLHQLCEQTGIPATATTTLAEQLMILMEGAIITAYVENDLEAGRKARRAAEAALSSAGGSS